MFLWLRKLKKNEGIEENYKTIFNTFKSRFICQSKTITLKTEFQKFKYD